MPAGRPKILTREDKKCSGCKELKQIDEFSSWSKLRGDGRSSYCKDCKNAHKREYRKLHPTRTNAHGHSVGGKKTSMYRRWQSMWEQAATTLSTERINTTERAVYLSLWPNDGPSFENFLADMGEPPPGMSLDRSDNVMETTEPMNLSMGDRA